MGIELIVTKLIGLTNRSLFGKIFIDEPIVSPSSTTEGFNTDVQVDDVGVVLQDMISPRAKI